MHECMHISNCIKPAGRGVSRLFVVVRLFALGWWCREMAVRFIKPPNPEDENLNVQFGRKKTRQRYLVVL